MAHGELVPKPSSPPHRSTAASPARIAARIAAGIAATLAAALLPPAPAGAETLPRFSGNAVWNQNIQAAAVHPDSATQISTLAGLGGFGFGHMQIDFGFNVVRAAPGVATRTLVSHPEGYFLPDCEPLGTVIPVPAGAAIEGGTNLVCNNLNNDCHLLVVQGRTLYEAYRSNAQGGSQLQAECLAIWHLDLTYPGSGRGEHCTSADAAGFPITPLLWNADDLAASLAIDPTGNGDIGHAIRFILPNERMANDPSLGGVGGRLYVRPGTHAGGPSGPIGSIAYGARLRLRADFPLTNYPPAAKVVLNTLKRYGMVLSDGGSVALTAESDLYTTTKWADLGIDSRVFDLTPGATDPAITDFVVLDTGPRIGETWECVRNNLVPPVFANGFESGNTTAWSQTVP